MNDQHQIYEEISIKLRNNKTIVLAQFDGDYNDEYRKISQKQGVEFFPRIILYPANNKKKPIIFEGKRDAATVISFITKNSVKIEPKKLKDERFIVRDEL